ncbi:MAG: hypothetical protein MI865_04105, partial [Proteobacteria bacterium]|nr:hypothetical protein [Pseudomonadota bacterium]
MSKFILWIPIVFWACADPGLFSDAPKSYFNLDSLICDQIEIMAQENPYVIKRVMIDDSDEEKRFQFNPTEWQDELDIFLDIDVNLPRYAGALNTTEENGIIKYVPKPNQNVPVKYAEYHFGADGELLKVVGHYLDDKAKSIYVIS